MNKNVLILFINFLAWPILAQDGQPIAKVETPKFQNKEEINSNPTEKVTSKNLHPLINESDKTAQQQADDKAFVEMCKKNFSSLKEASKFFADRGWEYLGETELDTALHRFNLCYLLDHQNIDSYWGIGVVCFQKGEFDNASLLLRKGMEIDSTNSSLIVDLAMVELSCYEKTNHQEDLVLAHNHLAKAIDIDPMNCSAWQKRAETEFYLENFENAWDCIHSVRLLDISKIDLVFVEKLNSKMIDPKKVFKF